MTLEHGCPPRQESGSTDQLPHCPEHPDTVSPTFLHGRHVQTPNEVHALVRTPRELQLIVALLAFRWSPDSPIIPSTCLLAAMLQCSHRTVRRTAEKIEKRGLLRRDERHEQRRQISNEYVLCGSLLTLVTRLEAGRDQDRSQPRPGGRSPMAGKRYEPNQRNRNTGNRTGNSQTRDYSATSSKCPACGQGHVPWTCRR